MSAMRSMRVVRWGAVALLVVYAVMHVLAIWTESINWDELALLARAEKAARTGVLDGGGRPGLAVVVLEPFVDGCDSVIAVVHRARLVWALFTFGLFAGAFFFIRAAAHRTSLATDDALLGVAAFMLLPVVMRWSLQVRTDQPAIACAIWGGVALLASRRHVAFAVLSGFAIGVGYLFSQKAIYIAAVVLLVAAGDVFADAEVRLRRAVLRLAALVAGAAIALALYRFVVEAAYVAPARVVTVEHGLDLFRWYRNIVGLRVYHGMLPTLWPQIALLVMVVHGFSLSRGYGASWRVSGIALGVIVAGLGVAMFHAAAFPYFAITLGVFVAIAIGIGWSSVRERAPRLARVGGGIALLVLVALAVPYRAELIRDTQAIQRITLAAADSLPHDLRGFHPDGALVCRGDPSPLPVFLRENVEKTFSIKHAEENSTKLIAEFRSRPVAFVVRTHRFRQFPRVIQAFWSEHYVPYAGTLDLAGARIGGESGNAQEIDVLVAGAYRWHPRGRERIAVEGRTLAAGDIVSLSAGRHVVTTIDRGSGDLVLAVDLRREPSSAGFYAEAQLAEISGTRSNWW